MNDEQIRLTAAFASALFFSTGWQEDQLRCSQSRVMSVI